MKERTKKILGGLGAAAAVGGYAYLMYVAMNPKTNNVNDIRFYLYSESFDENKETIIILHGLASNVSKEFPTNVRVACLKVYGNDYNIICVDWNELAGRNALEYFKVKKNLDKVAKRISDTLIGYVKTKNLDLAKVHLIGHSLGAHICGQVGRNVHESTGKKLRTIIGLDPAGLLFDGRKLDKNDVQDVDVYHTSDVLGMNESLGHLDVLINGGRKQPRCKGKDILGNCSHSESHRCLTKFILDGGAHPNTSRGFRETILRGANIELGTKGVITVNYPTNRKRQHDSVGDENEPVAKIGKLSEAERSEGLPYGPMTLNERAKALWALLKRHVVKESEQGESVRYEACAPCTSSSGH